ncbi:hypothetical protein SE17_24105 [Kouleothrix aurantiaca]|uniref:DUF1800 domain-containing protein n=1 Tax=Kouleothrix aurantiaca TaxID=186479 RepID=A0A0P9CZ57_9CHLR|nr:hypothetical protein SE17_24105 [Kouleothrix aurantiaca]
MALTRRHFLATTTALGAAGAVATFGGATAGALAAPPLLGSMPASVTLPPAAVIALNRMGFGPRAGDVAAFNALGGTDAARLQAYLEQQLSPAAIDDSLCDAKITSARLKIQYDAHTDADPAKSYPARNEAAPLGTLGQGIAALWPRARGAAPFQAWAERMRPFEEVRVATWLRAVYSKRQLAEVLADFWHNHFNVNVNSDSAIAATFPIYDRIVRTHSMGNFRTFLEEIAKSVGMMYYLDNVSNKAGGGEGGNENYARELFELHTLGSDNYLKFYDDRGSVGTITYNGKTYVRGYIDRDVYEAARCLSGWTLNNGQWEHPTPNDGTFLFYNDWHDNALKIVLGVQFPYNQGIADARHLFDLLCSHPGTARHLCTKLCRRLVSDTPSTELVEAATATWMANISAPDQIKRVLRTILLSDEFRSTWGQKLKRPFELIVSFLRGIGAELPVDELLADPNAGDYWSSLLWSFSAAGQRLFEWPTPTGHPDTTAYWANTNGMLRRWNRPYTLRQSWGGNVAVNIRAQTDAAVPGGSCIRIADYWIGRLCGYSLPAATRSALINFLAQTAQGGDPNQPPKPMNGEPNTAALITERLESMVQLLVMTPEFQLR